MPVESMMCREKRAMGISADHPAAVIGLLDGWTRRNGEAAIPPSRVLQQAFLY